MEPRCLQNLVTRHVVNVIADDGPRPVRPDGFTTIRIKVDGDGGFEASRLEAVVEASGAGIDAYRV